MAYTLLPDDEPAKGYTLLPEEPRSTGSELGRQAGLTARYVAEGLASIPGIIADPISAAAGAKPFSRWLSDALTSLGLPQPETKGERVVGDISRGVVGAGAGVGLGSAMAGAAGPVVSGIGQALQAAPGTQAISAASAGASGGLAREGGASEGGQLLAALLGGFGAPAAVGAAGVAIPAGYRGAKQLLKPFSEAGREEIVGNALNRIAVDPKSALANLRSADEIVPGSLPTTAQGSRDLGLIQLERKLASEGPLFASRKSANNSARNRMLEQVAGTKEELAAAEQQRSSQAAAEYNAARSDVPKDTEELQAAVADLEKRPAFREALRRAVDSLRNQGETVESKGNVRPAHNPAKPDESVDDIEAFVRKAGGINKDDEAVGSLSSMEFPRSVDGPVFRSQRFAGSSNRSHTDVGHSLEDMTAKLYQAGYVDSPNAFDDVMEKLYDTSRGVGTHYSKFRVQPNTDPLASAIEQLTTQLAQKNAPKAAGVDFVANGTKLAHEAKLQLDNMIDTAARNDDTNQVRVLTGVKEKLLSVIESPDFSPQYKTARENFAANSIPVERLSTAQKIQAKTHAAAPDVTGDPIISQAQWQRTVMANIDELGKKLSPDQIEKMKRIGADLDRGALSETAGRAAGSNTYQNLSTANILGAALGRGAATNTVGQSLLRPLQFIYRLPEPQVQDLLKQAMLEPKLAAALMAKATPGNVEFLGEALRFKARAMGLGAAIGTGTEVRQ